VLSYNGTEWVPMTLPEAINSLQNQINELKNPPQEPDNGGEEV
jgi:hypothetical protein